MKFYTVLQSSTIVYIDGGIHIVSVGRQLGHDVVRFRKLYIYCIISDNWLSEDLKSLHLVPKRFGNYV